MPTPFRVRCLRAFALCLILLLPVAARAAEPQTITVFAAASLTDAFGKVAERYRQQSPDVVRFSFAASSTLARQIEAGAPAAIFVSANEEWMDYLAAKSLIVPATRSSPLGNTLVMIAPSDSKLGAVAIAPGFDIAALVGDGRWATGDPANVPVGIYAKKAFESLGVWAVAEPLLARTDSVRAALALVERGEAPIGVVYGTDAGVSQGVKVVGVFPPDSYPPIGYPFAIVAGKDSDAVRAFFAFLTSGTAADVYRSFGFTWKGPTG